MMARGGFLLAASVTLAALMAGCTGGSTDVNPNLLAPKLIVDASVNGTPLVYVHSAFGERAYDLLEVRVDNETLLTREYAYSLETSLANETFDLEVNARAGESRFTFRGLVFLDLEEERARVTLLQKNGEWGNVQSEALPYSAYLDREGDGEEAST